MAKLEGKMLELNEEGLRLSSDLEAILEEHLPSELVPRARQLADDLESNAFSQSFEELRELYFALTALMPKNRPQIRAAFQATVFEWNSNDEADWQKFEKGELYD